MKNDIKLLVFAIGVLAGSLLVSCKKYADPPPLFEVGDSLVVKPPRKVLLVAIDGVSGAEMKAIMPSNISAILPHSKYTWDAYSSTTSTTVASWKTLLSGVNVSRHNILGYDSTFALVTGETDYEHQYIPFYPSFFNYILTSPQSDLRTAFVTDWADLIRYGAPEVATRITVGSDDLVRDSTVNLLKNSNNDIIVANLSGPARAGKTYGFSNTVPEYKAAVQKADGHIGDLLKALEKDRPSYSKEEWLVIITGTHGGINKSFGGSSDAEVLVPVIYYNPRFNKTEFTKEGAYTNVRIFGRTDAANFTMAALTGEDIYNVGNGQQTVQIKVKGSGASWPHFLSKQALRWNTPGWSLFASGSDWSLAVRSTTSGDNRLGGQTGGAPRTAFNNQWHTITFVFADSASKWWARMYTDGKRSATHDISGLRNSNGVISSPSPIRIGYGADPDMGGLDFKFADFMIFNTALTDAEINASICTSDITKHARYGNLIGYWPGNDAIGNYFRNKAPNAAGKDFALMGKFNWVTDPLVPCTVPTVAPSGQKIQLTTTSDISSQILYWFRIEDWKKEGTRWLNNYETEFIK